jgi:mannosyl-oligosaccharide alpha-1,2-mannosidase
VLKIFLLGNRTDPKLGAAYQTMAASIRTNLVKTCTDGSAFFAVRGGRQWQEHLACFAPGMLALGVLTGASGAPDEDTRVAIATGETCYRAYTNTPTGLAPDAWNFGAREQDYQPPVGIASERGPLPRCRGQVEATGSKFSLRPETIESLFYLYRLTRNETYRDYGWKIFEAIERHCRTRIGYAGLTNVYRLGASTMEDSEPSFFMAEVLKYLYLLFSDEDVLPLDKWVLNTEAHPFLVEHHPTHGLDEDQDKKTREEEEFA